MPTVLQNVKHCQTKDQGLHLLPKNQLCAPCIDQKSAFDLRAFHSLRNRRPMKHADQKYGLWSDASSQNRILDKVDVRSRQKKAVLRRLRLNQTFDSSLLKRIAASNQTI